jgi:hypothetical protein
MRKLAYLFAIVLGGVLLSSGRAHVAAQQQKAPPASAKLAGKRSASAKWPVMRTDGQPDIEGIWQPDWTWGCGQAAARGCMAPGTLGMNYEPLPNIFGSNRTSGSMIIDPPDGRIPYLPWARKRRDEIQDHYLAPTPAQVDTRTRGWPDGLPRLNWYYQFEIRQVPHAVVFLYEVQHEFRYVPLDGRPHLDDGVKMWMGSSRAHWEGTTLVVEVRNLTDQMRLDVVGDFASDGLRITERWKFVDANSLEYQATLEDPKVYSRPWTFLTKLKRFENPDYETFEYAGVEGTKDPDLIESLQKR